jgi:WD40 repeat protein
LFSPDGKHFALTDTNSILAWEIPSGESINISQNIFDQWHSSEGESRVYYSNADIIYSPSKKYSATIKNQNIVVLKDETLQISFLEIPHADVVSTMRFSPDGNLLATANAGVDIHIFFYNPSFILKEACSRLIRNLTRAEWQQYIGDALPYQAVCPNLPIEPEITITPTP